jgi:hypothetical protein
VISNFTALSQSFENRTLTRDFQDISARCSEALRIKLIKRYAQFITIYRRCAFFRKGSQKADAKWEREMSNDGQMWGISLRAWTNEHTPTAKEVADPTAPWPQLDMS